jgi:hypothetical protein
MQRPHRRALVEITLAVQIGLDAAKASIRFLQGRGACSGEATLHL